MDTLIFLLVLVAVVAPITTYALWKRRVAERLDSELTAYVAEGTVTPDTARAVLSSKATLGRKRDIAAHLAAGMEPDKALSLLATMAAS